MNKEYRLAHISDLHLSPDYFPERTQHFRSILHQCKNLNVDHIIITGDITNQARPHEFDHFREILQEFSLLDARKTTVVIGNHDIFGGPYHAEDVLNFPSICKETNYDTKIEEFYSTTMETFEDTRFFSSESIFPFLKIIDGIAIVGINSIARWSALKNPIGSNGIVDDEQHEALKTLLNSPLLKGKKIFVAIHHHFNKLDEGKGKSKLERLWLAFESTTMKLRQKKRLLKLFRKSGIEYILHGHVHASTEYLQNGIRCANAGGTMIPSKESIQTFHLFNVQAKNVTVESIHLQLPPASLQKKQGRIVVTKPVFVEV